MKLPRTAMAVGLAVSVLLVGGFASPTAGAPTKPRGVLSGACTGAWELVDSPNPDDNFNVLRDVAALSPDDVWAVGSYGGQGDALLAHWTGTSWELHDFDIDVSTSIQGVAFASSADGWAVGFTYGIGGVIALVLHWDGTAWSQVETPTSVGITLTAVDVVSPDDAWAVGYSSEGTVVEHWDGSTWTIVPSPSATGSDNLWGVSAISSTDAWAVGFSGMRERQLIEHWDGIEWSIVDTPADLHARLDGVAHSPTGAWAVGFGPRYTSLIERWDGTRWRPVSAPQPGPTSSLNDVAVVSTRQAWAVGSYTDEAGDIHPLVDGWDGTRWRVAPSAPVAIRHPQLLAVSASSRSDAWAVGTYTDNGTFTLVERRCMPGGP